MRDWIVSAVGPITTTWWCSAMWTIISGPSARAASASAASGARSPLGKVRIELAGLLPSSGGSDGCHVEASPDPYGLPRCCRCGSMSSPLLLVSARAQFRREGLTGKPHRPSAPARASGAPRGGFAGRRGRRELHRRPHQRQDAFDGHVHVQHDACAGFRASEPATTATNRPSGLATSPMSLMYGLAQASGSLR